MINLIISCVDFATAQSGNQNQQGVFTRLAIISIQKCLQALHCHHCTSRFASLGNVEIPSILSPGLNLRISRQREPSSNLFKFFWLLQFACSKTCPSFSLNSVRPFSASVASPLNKDSLAQRSRQSKKISLSSFFPSTFSLPFVRLVTVAAAAAAVVGTDFSL